MSDETPRLNLNTYEAGDTDWSHTDAVEALDEHAIDRGPIAERPTEGDYDDELYHAIDQRITWRWDASSEDWEYFSGPGSEGDPTPGTVYRESVNTEYAQSNRFSEILQKDAVRNHHRSRYPGSLLTQIDISEWSTVNSPELTLSEDSENHLTGTKSLRIDVTSGADGSQYVDYNPSSNFDISGQDLSIGFRYEGIDPNIRFEIRIFAPDPSNQLQVRYEATAAQPSGWLRISPSVHGISGNPDLSDVDRFRFNFFNSNWSAGTLWVDSPRVIDRPSKVYVVLQFDDTNENHYTETFPDMKKYGFRGSFAANPGHILNGGASGRMDETQADEMLADGHEFVNHTPYHDSVGDKSESEVREIVSEGREMLIEMGAELGADFFVPPGNKHSGDTIDWVLDYHKMATGPASAGSRAHGLFGQDVGAVPRFTAADRSACESMIADAKQFGLNQAIVFMFHDFGDSATMSRSEFDTFQDTLFNDNDVEVVTMRELYQMRISGQEQFFAL